MSAHPAKLVSKIRSRSANVCVMGQGYVGLPLAMRFCAQGFQTVGFDIDPFRVERLNDGHSEIEDVPDSTLRSALNTGTYRASLSPEVLANSDVLVICVPTPLSKSKSPDLSFVLQATGEIAKIDIRGKLIVLESTTYPGATRELLVPAFSTSGLRLGEDYFLAFSPERIDPGNTLHTLQSTPKILGGCTPSCLEVAYSLYEQIVDRVVRVSSVECAEMVKLLENTYRAVNIGLVNEMAISCDLLNINAWEVIEAASTKPYGFQTFYPGPGLGGHCIPVDPHYLNWKLKSLNHQARLVDVADSINSAMPSHVCKRIQRLLNNQAKPVRGSTILILGVAYKRDISDTRESPALHIIADLLAGGGNVLYHDPYVPHLEIGNARLSSICLDSDMLKQTDLMVVVADHTPLDYEWICQQVQQTLDCRNVTRGFCRKYPDRITLL